VATAGIVILCLLLLLFAFISLGTGAVYTQEAKKHQSTWKAAPGSVIHSKLHIQKGSAVPYFPTTDQKTHTNTVEFSAFDGQTYTVDLGGAKALPVNRPVTVHYDPADPEHTATLASPAGTRTSGYSLQVLSVVLVLAAAAIVYGYFFA
jgi:Protein of unknown function (DUF3592)